MTTETTTVTTRPTGSAAISAAGSAVPSRSPAPIALRRRKKPRSRIFGYILVWGVTIVMMLPIVWMVIGSLQTTKGMAAGDLLPIPATLGNYAEFLRETPFLQYLFNSVTTTIVIVMAQVITSALAAYALVFTRVRGRKIIFGLVLMSMMIPIQAIFIPDYVLLSKLGWINTYEALIVPWIGSGFGIFFLRQSFQSIPRSLLEAMKIDGATHRTILFRLVIPNTFPSVVTLGLINGIFHFGYLFWPLLVTQTPSMRVLPVGLSYLTGPDTTLNWNVVMAGNVFTILLPVALFVFAQKYIVKGVLGYATK